MTRKPFKNLSDTPQFAEGYNIVDVIKAALNRPKDHSPPFKLPSVTTDLKHYYSRELSLIWFGHSSYLIHVDGINILVDPVLSGYAAPVKFMVKAFDGSNMYSSSDMPQLDYLILTHNHYDHLDYNALKILMPKTNHIILPMGVRNDLKGINIAEKKITELNWWEGAKVGDNISITSTPARHFSGRGLKRNLSLWTSYVLEIFNYKLFIGV